MLNGFFSNNNTSDSRSNRFARDSRFDKNWGKASPVEKVITKTDHLQPEAQVKQDLHGEILQGCKSNMLIANRGNLLGHLTSDSMAFLKTFREKFDGRKEQQELCNLTENELLSLLFELLKVYAYEYNSAVGLGPFHLELNRPQAVTEILRADKNGNAQETVTYYRARIATSTHALCLRADNSGLVFYVMPVERTLGLSRQEALFEPDSALQIKKHKGRITWETKAGLPLTMSRVEAMSRALFQWLIERTADRVAEE